MAYIAPEGKHALAKVVESTTWAEPARTPENIAMINANPDGEEVGSIAVNLLHPMAMSTSVDYDIQRCLSSTIGLAIFVGPAGGTLRKPSLLSVPQRRIMAVQATVIATLLPY